MTRSEYYALRRTIRDNGRMALRWMSPSHRAEWDHLLFNIQDFDDKLAEREDIVRWCRRENIYFNFRHLQR